jgi:hypothetical protein
VNVHDLQAPAHDGAILAEPPLADVAPQLARNTQLLATSQCQILDQPLATLRKQAQAAALDAARAYHAEAGEPLPQSHGGGLLIAGHQPELFHPGVWIKNFALNALAKRHDRAALNLVVDNDTAKNCLIRLPADDHLATVAYDHWQGGIPYEERPVLEEAFFADFPERVAPYSRHWPFQPMLADFWTEARRQAQRTDLLGERLASSRRTFERAWGCHNFELPLSRLCRLEPFARFGCHLLENLSRFHDIYNAAVESYRIRYWLRSRNHPVPNLAREGDWLEMPLWSWLVQRPRRQRLLAKRCPAGFQLRSGPEEWPCLRGARDDLVEQWLGLEKEGRRIRTRALTTTLFARLFLADSFMHGLGGGKYDELTDGLMRDFFGIEPPAFLVLTGSLRLPFPKGKASEDDHRRLARQRRDLFWNPQRYLLQSESEGESKVSRIILDRLNREKAYWAARSCPTHSERLERFQQLRRVNAELRRFVAEQEIDLGRALEEVTRQMRIQESCSRRDFAFCLYPAEKLEGFFKHVTAACGFAAADNAPNAKPPLGDIHRGG